MKFTGLINEQARFGEDTVSKELKLILRETPVGLPPTPEQAAQRDKFARVARECREEFKGSRLRGETKIRAMNAFMSRRLREPE